MLNYILPSSPSFCVQCRTILDLFVIGHDWKAVIADSWFSSQRMYNICGRLHRFVTRYWLNFHSDLIYSSIPPCNGFWNKFACRMNGTKPCWIIIYCKNTCKPMHWLQQLCVIHGYSGKRENRKTDGNSWIIEVIPHKSVVCRFNIIINLGKQLSTAETNDLWNSYIQAVYGM